MSDLFVSLASLSHTLSTGDGPPGVSPQMKDGIWNERALAATNPALMTLSSGLLAYWKLNGNSVDYISGASSTDIAVSYSAGNGKVNQGAGFVIASGSRIITPFMPPLGAAPRTVACWLRIDAAELGNRGIWGYGHPNTVSSFGLTLQNGWLRFLDGGSIYAFYNYGGAPTGWLSVVLDYNGTQVGITLNGAPLASMVIPLNTLNNNSFNIGDAVYPGFQTPTASIDEVGIWNRVWTPTEHADWYNSGAGRTPPFYL